MTLRDKVFASIYAWNTRLEALARRARLRFHLDDPLHIVPYLGFGTPERVQIRARVLEGNVPAPFREGVGLGAALRASYQRYATLPLPGADIEARWNGATWSGATDLEGFLWLDVVPPAVEDRTSWHEVGLTLLSPLPRVLPVPGSDFERGRTAASARVLVTGSQAEFGVVSDIDDTMIETGVSSLRRRALALFLTDRLRRRPFAGVRELYAALHDGAAQQGQNPLFYVSSSPWNLHEHVEALLRSLGFPMGPILLRDWGLSPSGFAPGGGHGHKRAAIRTLFAAHARLPFVLLGDDSQEDMAHYRAIAHEHPGRVRAIVIRAVTHDEERRARTRRTADEAKHEGISTHVVETSGDAAHVCAELGLLDPARVPLVRNATVA